MNPRVEPAALLEATDLHFAYAPAKPVIRGISLRLEGARLAALIGSNGCGKSTLVRLLAGLVTPSSGAIRFDGRSLGSIPPRQLAQRIAYVPQAAPMAFPFTALEVVVAGRSPYGSGLQFETAADVAKARGALAAVGAPELAPRRMTELSGGERQLITMARAIAQEPACLLLDEPSASLDLRHRADLVRLLVELRDRQGVTSLLVTQDLELVDSRFDTVLGLHAGTLAAAGAPGEVLTDSVLQSLFGDPAVRTARLEGRTFVWSERP